MLDDLCGLAGEHGDVWVAGAQNRHVPWSYG